MPDIKPGDPVWVLDQVGVAAPVRAKVTDLPGPYVRVRYDTGRTDTFWRESGWRAWDGEMRWRLEPYAAEVAKTFGEEG